MHVVFKGNFRLSKTSRNTKHMHWILYLNLVIDRFKCYSACVLSL